MFLSQPPHLCDDVADTGFPAPFRAPTLGGVHMFPLVEHGPCKQGAHPGAGALDQRTRSLLLWLCLYLTDG